MCALFYDLKNQSTISLYHNRSKVSWLTSIYLINMKKAHNLPENVQKIYFGGKNQSKSPLNNLRKATPNSIFSKTPPKHFPIMGITFSTKASTRTLGLPSESQPKPHKKHQVNRQMTIEMEQLCGRSDLGQPQESGSTPQSTKRDEDEYFYRSLAKVSEIRLKYSAKLVSGQLMEVLNMIKQEKLKISQKMKILQKNNEYYRRLCEGHKIETEDKETNTIDILDEGIEPVLEEESAQVNPEQLSPLPEPVKEEVPECEKKESEVYLKLCSMLSDMSIDYRQILPESEVSSFPLDRQYKLLTDAEIIKIQRFFINKLSSRLYSK